MICHRIICSKTNRASKFFLIFSLFTAFDCGSLAARCMLLANVLLAGVACNGLALEIFFPQRKGIKIITRAWLFSPRFYQKISHLRHLYVLQEQGRYDHVCDLLTGLFTRYPQFLCVNSTVFMVALMACCSKMLETLLCLRSLRIP